MPTSGTMSLLNTADLGVAYGITPVLHGITLEMAPNECIAVLGMGRKVAGFCQCPALTPATTDLHDLPRFLVGPLLDQVNRVRESVDE